MNKKTIIRLVALFIFLLVLIAVVEIAVRSVSTKTEERKNESKPVVLPTVLSREKERENTFISETNEVLELFRKRDYETIYSRFTQIYKYAKYPTLQSFEEAMNKIINEDSNIEISDLISHPLGYYATFLIDNDKKINLVVDNIGKENMTIVLDAIDEITSMEISTGSDEVNIDFNYFIKYYSGIGYSVEVKNQTNRPINFEVYKNSYEYSNSKYNKNNYYIEEEINEVIEAGATKLIEFKFPVPYSLVVTPDMLDLHYGVNGKEYKSTLYVTYEDIGEDGDDF